MPIHFQPFYHLSPRIAKALSRIEAVRQSESLLNLAPIRLKSLAKQARLQLTYYFALIEDHDPDKMALKGYLAALKQVKKWSREKEAVSERLIKRLHALVMTGGVAKTKEMAYRDGQNAVLDGATNEILYLPPKAKDVPLLMKQLVSWINEAKNEVSCPVMAAIAHFGINSIHPYYDGNGRTARLLTKLLLDQSGYSLRGLCNLEEYYAKDLAAYYEALAIEGAKSFYRGRAKVDITSWIEYFCEGMAECLENVLKRMEKAKKYGVRDRSEARTLGSAKQKAVDLLGAYEEISAKQVGQLFGYSKSARDALCHTWVEEGFLTVVNSSKRNRKYSIAKKFRV